MTDTLLIGLVASVGPMLVGAAALVQANRNGRQMSTSNGHTAGELVEATNAAVLHQAAKLDAQADRIEALHQTFDDHIAEDRQSFAYIHQALGLPKETG